jgi:hypothetical protein
MIDVEQRLRELGEQVNDSAAIPNLPSPRTLKRIRVRQRAVSLASVGAVAVIVGSFFLWGPSLHFSIGNGPAGGGTVNKGPSGGPALAPPGWVIHHTGSGLSIATPRHWIFRAGNVTVRRPTISFRLGTWRFPSGGACAPTKALQAIPKKGMLLYMLEYSPLAKPPGSFMRRPTRFTIEPSQASFECIGVSVHTISFREHHRYFQIHIKFGPDTTGSLRRKTVESLNTLQIARR